MELIVTDEEAAAVRRLIGCECEEVKEREVKEEVTEVSGEEKEEEVKEVKDEGKVKEVKEEKEEEVKEDEKETTQEESETPETKVEAAANEEATTESPTTPINPHSTYLWCLLLEIVLHSDSEIVPHLVRVLLQAFAHLSTPSDIPSNHLPLIVALLESVKAEEQRGDFHAPVFGRCGSVV